MSCVAGLVPALQNESATTTPSCLWQVTVSGRVAVVEHVDDQVPGVDTQA